MASPPDAGGPRHVGRVVDPLVREDGGSTPDVQLEAAPEPAEPESAPTPADDQEIIDENGSGHPVRDRLLRKAAAVRRGLGLDEVGEPETSPLSTQDSELDQVEPASRAPSAPFGDRGRSALSPRAIAVFGCLLGLATIASLVAILIQLDGRHHPPPEEGPKQAAAKAAPADFTPPPVKKRVRKKVAGPWRIADAKGQPGTKILEGKIGSKPFLRVVQDKGLKKSQAYRVYNTLKGLKNLDKCARSDRFAALVDRSTSKVKAFEYVVSKEEVYQAKEDAADGRLKAAKLNLKIEREQYAGGFMLDGEGFEAAAKRAGFEAGIGKVVTKALEGFASVQMMRKGDRVRLVAQEVTVLGEFARYAGVEAVEYLSADSGTEPIRVYYFRGPRSRGYFDAKGRSLYEGGWRKPIKGAPITSRFNPKRLHPVLKKVMPHNGTDFGAPTGTPIRASSYGTISFIGYAGASGNLVKIEHPRGIETGYAHCSKFEPGLKVGDRVKRLQVVGYVGSTGRSTGPHLHFSAKKDGRFIDPESLNLDAMAVLPADERELFREHKTKYDRLLDGIALPKAPEAPKEPAALEEPSETPIASAAEAPEAPAAEPQAREPQAAPASASPGSAVYLTDEELLKMQAREDDGEVDE